MAEPGQAIAGTGMNKIFRSTRRVSETYGGGAEDWVKKSSFVYPARMELDVKLIRERFS